MSFAELVLARNLARLVTYSTSGLPKAEQSFIWSSKKVCGAIESSKRTRGSAQLLPPSPSRIENCLTSQSSQESGGTSSES